MQSSAGQEGPNCRLGFRCHLSQCNSALLSCLADSHTDGTKTRPGTVPCSSRVLQASAVVLSLCSRSSDRHKLGDKPGSATKHMGRLQTPHDVSHFGCLAVDRVAETMVLLPQLQPLRALLSPCHPGIYLRCSSEHMRSGSRNAGAAPRGGHCKTSGAPQAASRTPPQPHLLR